MGDREEIKTENDSFPVKDEPQSDTLFKRKTRRNIRIRKSSQEDNEEEGEDEVKSKLEKMKQIQNLRKRPHGVNILGLALGTKVTAEQECLTKDPFKIKAGGMVNMSALKSGKMKQVDDAYDTGIGTQFSVETNKRDEDEEMMKYIEEELSKKKDSMETQRTKNNKKFRDDDQIAADSGNVPVYTSPEEAALRAVPEHLRESSTKRSEEMLSNQMLNGIPEVDLGIEAKIKNIEATEDAKLRLLWEKQNKKDGPSQFVPTNMAVDFMHHNRFNIDRSDILARKQRDMAAKTSGNGDGSKSGGKTKEEKATDDYHFEKFKKQFRRY